MHAQASRLSKSQLCRPAELLALWAHRRPIGGARPAMEAVALSGWA